MLSSSLAVDATTVDVVFFATAIVIVVTAAVVLITSLFLFVTGAVVASITVNVIFLDCTFLSCHVRVSE